MKKTAWVSLLAVALLFLAAPPVRAWERWHHRPFVHSRVIIGFGPAWYWGPPYYYYPPPVVYSPPPVVMQPPAPPVYIEQPPPQVSAVPTMPPQAESGYWYYCPSSNAYYPSVPSCSEAWVRVAPR